MHFQPSGFCYLLHVFLNRDCLFPALISLSVKWVSGCHGGRVRHGMQHKQTLFPGPPNFGVGTGTPTPSEDHASEVNIQGSVGHL